MPTCRPVTQEHYAAVRAAIYQRWERTDVAHRRLLYLDFVRYTGAHKHDADTLAGHHVDTLLGSFERRNLKNHRSVESLWIEMPASLAEPMRAEFERRGWARGRGPVELICGRWDGVTHKIAKACDALKVPRFTLLDLRSTVATELAQAGRPLWDAVQLLGHASSQMVQEVYRRVSSAQLSEAARAIGRTGRPAAKLLRIADAMPAAEIGNGGRGDAEADEPERIGPRNKRVTTSGALREANYAE